MWQALEGELAQRFAAATSSYKSRNECAIGKGKVADSTRRGGGLPCNSSSVHP